jgi:ATP-dependent Lon protease
LSEALLDRLEWIGLSSMSEAEEIRIVEAHQIARVGGPGLVPDCVALVRLTRSHSKVKRGASIRASITLARLVADAGIASIEEPAFRDAAKTVLANRIELQSGKFSKLPYSELLDELLEELLESLKKKS